MPENLNEDKPFHYRFNIFNRKRNSNHHLRVKIFYDESVDNLEPGKTTLVKQVYETL